MDRRDFLKKLGAATMTSLLGGSGALRCRPLRATPTATRTEEPGRQEGRRRHLETVGMYAQIAEADRRFWRECGYNLLQIWETTFLQSQQDIPLELARLAGLIDAAQDEGFRVTVLLSSNLRRQYGKAAADWAQWCFSPSHEPEALKERLEDIRRVVRELRHADAFSVCAGDPGGDPTGRSTWRGYAKIVLAARDVVKEEAPQAEVFANTWGIGHYGEWLTADKLAFWEQETANARAFLEEVPGPEISVELPLHNYYRSRTLTLYHQAGRETHRWPDRALINRLRRRGARHIYSWPYFLIDKCDEGSLHVGAANPQSELRYLASILRVNADLGLDGSIGNASVGIRGQQLNQFAFARFCQDLDRSPGSVMDEFARLISAPETAPVLAQVFRFLENHSTWHFDLPKPYRLPDLPCELAGWQAAAKAAASVKPQISPEIALNEPVTTYLERITTSLIQRGEKEAKPGGSLQTD